MAERSRLLQVSPGEDTAGVQHYLGSFHSLSWLSLQAAVIRETGAGVPRCPPGPLHALGRGWCISSRNVLGGAQRGVKKELNLSALVTSAQNPAAAQASEPTPSLSSSRDCCGEQCPENRGRDVCSYPRPALTIFLSSVPVNHSLFR